MVQARGPTLKYLDDTGDRYARTMRATIRRVLSSVADRLDSNAPSVDDLSTLMTLWRNEVDETLMPELEGIWFESAENLRTKLQTHAEVVSPEEDAEAASAVTAAIDIPQVANTLAEAYLASRTNFLVNVGNDVWEVARSELLNGLRDGESVDELRNRVVNTTDLASPRAEVVARTEVVGASNSGSMQQMRATGLPATKEWVATNDDRTRPEHRAVDGQTVSVDESFSVGGFPMDRPHDESAPADLVVNCRCTVIFNVAEEGFIEENQPSLVAAGDYVQDSAMIALIPSDEDLDRLTLDGGEDRDELHLTLWFLGKADEWNDDTRDRLTNAIQSSVDNHELPVVKAHAFGVNYWNPSSDYPAWVLSVGDDNSDAKYGSLVPTREIIEQSWDDLGIEHLVPEQHSPWVAHVTLLYSDDTSRLDEMTERLGEVTFDKIRLDFSDDVRDIQLSAGRVTLASADGGTTMPWSKVENHDECGPEKPWGVVKDETGEVVGCHASEEDADEQIAALYAIEDEDDDAGEIDYSTSNTKSFQDDDKSVPNISSETAPWQGVLVVEGVSTGDGREFASEALTWPDLPVPLRWNKEDSHGGEPHTVAVNVGRIDEIWRDGNKLMGRGVIDLGGEHGTEVYRLLKNEFLRGVSVDVDDVSDADLEMVFPDDDDSPGDDDLAELFMMPEKIIFHAGRIRAATLVDIPAFVEAYIEVDGESVVASASTKFGAVAPHETATSDAEWDGSANEQRLPSPMSEDVAREAYAWIDEDEVEDGEVTKSAGRFIHHEINDDGSVGPANLTACSSGIGILNGGRGGTTIPRDDWQGVYDHLAKHLRDADREPPPADFVEERAIMASAEVDERPPREWFENPNFSLPTGITVTDAGRVYGHAAMWGECHVGRDDVCVTAPHEDDHPYFMTGEVVCSDGSRFAVGQITLGTGHAPLSLGASRAAEHYDNTGTVVADVATGNDEHGIWVAGAIRPGVDAARVRELRASGQVSGDWRRIGGQLRLVGLLAVNVPGFPVPKLQTRVASGAPLALVAAGRPTIARPVETEEDMNRRALKAMRDSFKRRVHGT